MKNGGLTYTRIKLYTKKYGIIIIIIIVIIIDLDLHCILCWQISRKYILYLRYNPLTCCGNTEYVSISFLGYLNYIMKITSYNWKNIVVIIFTCMCMYRAFVILGPEPFNCCSKYPRCLF